MINRVGQYGVWIGFALLILATSGCASVDPYAAAPMAHHLEREDVVGYCARLFAEVDRRVDALGVRDAEAPRVAGFPYLRVDRFGEALGRDAASRTGAAQDHAWRARLHQLDETARAAELSNAALSIDDLPRCRALLAAADASAMGKLRAVAKAPDSYSISMRALGVYPLARLPFAAGVAEWQAATRAVFATPLEALPVRGRLQRYALRPTTVAPPAFDSLDRFAVDSLGVPVLSRAELAALFIRHAPVLEVDVAGSFDRPGALSLDADDRVAVEAALPVAYTRLASTYIGGLIHPQLVYTFWFSERTSSGAAIDLLAGKIDGVVWRVTLDRAGEALVYDSMHACGCYHLFFPTGKVVARELPKTLDESLFVPQLVPVVRTNESVLLRIESGTHYLQRVSVGASPTAAEYVMEDEHKLTMLPRRSGGTRSAFGEDGLIAGSERAERWFFWPMGIASAGQMRQWGHHATAFVGRRHFDDPHLFDTYFEIRR